MNILSIMLAVFLLFAAGAFGGQQVKVGSLANNSQVTVETADNNRTVLNFEVGAFNKQPVEINGEKYFRIDCEGEGLLYQAGCPALPKMCRSIIIPDNTHMRVKVLSAEYRDFPNTPVLPSKGHIKRTVNPADIPYTFADIYSRDEWFPASLASLDKPYILRDFRGQVIEIYPFRYNPSSKTLRVYTSIKVEVIADGPGLVNVLQRREPFTMTTPDFDQIYRRRFINYNTGDNKALK